MEEAAMAGPVLTESGMAIARALNPRHHPVRAEQLFYLFKALRKNPDGRLAVSSPIAAVRKWFSAPAVYSGIRQLENLGVVEAVLGGWRGREIVELRFLKEDLSIPRKKRARKVPLQSETKAPEVEAAAPENVQPVFRGVLAFVDLENALITAKNTGTKIDLAYALRKIRQKAVSDQQTLLRIFLYFSEGTERNFGPEIFSYLGLEPETLRFVKTANGPDSVDRRICEDMLLFLNFGFGGIFVLSTNDGGKHFSSAVETVKKAGKKIVLVTLAGAINHSLAAKTDIQVKAVPQNPRGRDFAEIIRAVRFSTALTRRLESGVDIEFLGRIAEELLDLLNDGRRDRFLRIVEELWRSLSSVWAMRGYTQDDCREAVSMLKKVGRVLNWDRVQDFNEYYLNPQSVWFLKKLGRFRT